MNSHLPGKIRSRIFLAKLLFQLNDYLPGVILSLIFHQIFVAELIVIHLWIEYKNTFNLAYFTSNYTIWLRKYQTFCQVH